MPSTVQLHKLINCMDKAEKKFFRTYHKLVSNRKYQTHLLQLYDALESMNTFSEDHFAKNAAGKPFAKNLSVNKVKLEGILLKAPTIYHLDKAVENNLAASMVCSKILIEKGLPDMARRELDQARKIASQYELFDFHVALNAIAEIIPVKDFPANIQNMAETDGLLKKISNRDGYAMRRMESRHLLYTTGMNVDKMKAEAQRMLALEEYTDLERALSFKAKTQILNIKKQFLFVEQKFDEVYQILLDEIALWKQYPYQIELNPRALFHFMRDAIVSNVSKASTMAPEDRQDLAKEAAAMLTDMRESERKYAITPRRKLVARGVILECEIYFHQYYSPLESFISCYKRNLPELEILKAKNGLGFRGLLTFIKLEITSFLFINKQLELAGKIIAGVLNVNKQEVAIDVYAYFCFFDTLICYENRELSLMSSRIGTFERHLKANDLMAEGEKAVVDILKELLHGYKSDSIEYINRAQKIPLEEFKFRIQLLKVSNFKGWLGKMETRRKEELNFRFKS